jgi:hypothetical protein
MQLLGDWVAERVCVPVNKSTVPFCPTCDIPQVLAKTGHILEAAQIDPPPAKPLFSLENSGEVEKGIIAKTLKYPF